MGLKDKEQKVVDRIEEVSDDFHKAYEDVLDKVRDDEWICQVCSTKVKRDPEDIRHVSYRSCSSCGKVTRHKTITSDKPASRY